MALEFVSTSDPRMFVFDMEFLGDLTKDLHNTRIHSIAAVHCATKRSFSVTVDPAVSLRRLRAYPTFSGCREVTRSWLKRNGAIPLREAFARLVAFVADCARECGAAESRESTALAAGELANFPAIFAAHGCFRGDLPVLKSGLRRSGIPFPPAWRFFDSLLFFRRVLPPVRTNGSVGFTLQAISAALGVVPQSGPAHDALPDAEVLHAALLRYPHVCGALYTWWQTPLTTVSGLGLQSQTILIRRGVRSVEELLNFAQRARGDARDRSVAHARIASALTRMGVASTSSKVAKWCVETVGIFDETFVL